MRKLALFTVVVLLCTFSVSNAQDNVISEIAKQITGLSIDMQWFLSYQNGKQKGKEFNQFGLKRGYVNIKKRINKTFSGRITTDITTDKEGDGEGDVEMRLKYLYLKTELPDFAFFCKPYFEFGLVHTPWLDFEQHINLYRVQGSMFMDRNKIASSADYGLVFMSNFGGEMDENYKKNVNKSYAGRYGSISVGVFNGGGYHALEKNLNKAFASRVTIRPLPELIPGFQLTYHNAFGKGNTEISPDWNYNSGFLSFESSTFIFTSEYFAGNGNFGGSAVVADPNIRAAEMNGYSFFTELKLFNKNISLIGRYDRIEQEKLVTNLSSDRYIVGVAYHFIKGSKIIIDYDMLDYNDSAIENSNIFEIAVELKY
ncbi:MAG: hypothetical protein SCALA702_03930 [Melioribacteraceae bacterium]|nr:MAG: hypothetical protein SCALA702_03930 [Melioribacteraceae bacterium]